jgi:hypothetical protein
VNGPIPANDRVTEPETPRVPGQAEAELRSAGLRPSRVPTGASDSVEQAVARPGSPLPSAIRIEAERRFARSLAGVRLHTDSEAAASATAIQARAYTVGSHIVFAAGEYQPDTQAGRQLLTHELTHVAQQASSAPVGLRIGNMLPIGSADSAPEREAERIAAGHNGMPTAIEPVASAVRRQTSTVATEPVKAPQPSPTPAAETTTRSTLSAGGKIWFKKEGESPKGPIGPFDVFVSGSFEGEAEIAPDTAKTTAAKRKTEPEAVSERKPAATEERSAEHGEPEAGWEFRAGTTHNLGKATDQGVKAELERKLSEHWPGLLELLRPDSVKAEGDLTGKGASVSFGAKWSENERVNYELMLTPIEADWKEGKVRVLDVSLSRNYEGFHQWVLGGALVTVTIKGVVTIHAEPNWKAIGAWLAANGVAVAAGIVVGVGVVVGIGYGLYQVDQSYLHGKNRMIGVDFVEGYAEALAGATEQFPVQPPDAVELLTMHWQSELEAVKDDYLADRISIFAAGSLARRAGRAYSLQSMGKVVVESGEEAWRRIAEQHRAQYGISVKERREKYMSIMFSQIDQKQPAGFPLSAH